MAIKFASNLSRNRYGVLHFRLSVPPDLRTHFKTKEIYRSLRTASINEATSVAQTLSIAFKRVFKEIRQQSMSDNKNTPKDALGGSEWGLIPEISLDEFMRPRLRLIPEPGDTPEDRIQAQAEFLRAAGFAGAAQQAPAKDHPASPLLSETVADFVRAKRAQGKWTLKTEEEYGTVYSLFIRIVTDQPIADVDDEKIIDYVETLKSLPANLNKLPAYVGKTIAEVIALKPPPMSQRTINKNIERVSSLLVKTRLVVNALDE